MPNIPLPKPAPPKPTNSGSATQPAPGPGVGGQIPAGQTVSVKPPAPPSPVPPASNPVPPTPAPTAPSSGSPTTSISSNGSASGSAPAPKSNEASASPSIPPQTPPTFPGGSTPPPNEAQMPPKTLSALQSMSSSSLPGLPQNSAPNSSSAGSTAGSKPGAPPSGGPNVTSSKPNGDQAGQNGNSPELAKPKKSVLRFLPIILGIVLVLAVVGFAAYWFLGRGGGSSNTTEPSTTSVSTPIPSEAPKKSVDLEYWGLWEPNSAMEAVIEDYESENPGVTISYKKQSYQDYRERLKNAIVSGNGPDLFRYHAAWVPMLQEELAPLPSAVMTSSEFATTFYPVAAKQLNIKGQIVGIPLMYEGLALYYNTEVFSTAVEEPPTTWSELRAVAQKLTVRADNGTTRAGVALGNATNVEHFADILAVLMLQNGADLTKPNSAETRDALLFYTNFITTDRVWDSTLPSSTIAFAQGDVAMMLAPSWRAHEVRAANPNLPFAVVPLPQLSDNRITWASYWAEGVSEQSENKEEAWQFIKYMSSKEVLQKLHSEQSQLRAFGELYSRTDLANDLADDPIMSAYLQDAPYATGWYMSSYTHDDGLNDNIIKYYEDAVTSLVGGASIDDVLETLDQGVRQELRQYGIAADSP